jgi:putative protease
MVELLAPGGNIYSVSAALENGADYVYIGLNGLNMRDSAKNFSLEGLKEIVDYVHSHDCRIYLATNTILKDKDISYLESILPDLNSYEVDALIVSDLGMVEIAQGYDFELHLSVQNNISNTASLKALKKLGVIRAILSRELSLMEITEIAKNSPIETEIFVHGAMCMGISGRCFLSYGLYGESANCGKCLQPCRKEWIISSSENNDSIIYNEDILIDKAYDDSYKTIFLSPQDLTMIEHIPRLMKTNVDAFKIEGRGRAADYVATATRVFREAINSYEESKTNNTRYEYNPKWMEDLKKVFNRGYDTGFYFNQPYQTSQNNQASHIKEDIGQVVNYYNKINVAELRLWNDLKLGDEIIIQGKTTGSINHKVKSMEINGLKVKKANKGQNVAIAINKKLRKNDYVYKLIERK